MKILTTVLIICFGLFRLDAQNIAPDFTVTLTDGQTKSLYKDYLDKGKTVVLKLFFVDCPPCRAHAPLYQDLYEEWGQGIGPVEFFHLSTSTFDLNQTVLAYDQANGHTFKAAGSDGGSLQAILPYRNGTFGPFQGTPTFVVIAPNRSLTFDIRGTSPANTMELLNQAILNTGAIKPPVGGLNITLSGQIRKYNKPEDSISEQKVALYQGTELISIYDGSDYKFVVPFSNLKYTIRPIDLDVPFRSGISTADILKIQKHILASEVFTSPFQVLASDCNTNNFISAADLVSLRKLLLFRIEEFENAKSIRYIPYKNFDSTVSNVLQHTFLDYYEIFANENHENMDFRLIKIGDVTGDF